MHGLNCSRCPTDRQTDKNQIALNYGVHLSSNCNLTIKILNAADGVPTNELLTLTVSHSDYLIVHIMHLIAYVLFNILN